MKKFKNLISEIQQPLSQGEKNFKDMHGDLPAAIEKAKKLVPGITDQPNVFNGIEKTNSIKTGIDKNISDYDKGLKVNEATMAGIDSRVFANKFRENEENNDHSENVKLLAKHFGTEADYKKAVDIHNEHMKIGHLPKYLGKLRHTLYTKLIKYAQPHFDMVKKETNEALNRPVDDVIDSERFQQKMKDKGYVRNYSSVLPGWKKETPATPATPAKKETNEAKMSRSQKTAAVRRFFSHDPEVGEKIIAQGAKERGENKAFASAKKEINRVSEALGSMANFKKASKFNSSNVSDMIRGEKARKASQDLGVPAKDHKQAYSKMRKDDMGMDDEATTRKIIGEKSLTPAEIKKREEIAKSMERDNPDMPMDKKMAIATAAAKRVAEADDFALRNKTEQHKKYTDKNAEIAKQRTTEVKTMVNHDCAKHIAHEEWGFGTCIPGEHTIVETSQGEGYVTHYDIMFEHGIEYDVPVEDIKVIMSETHGHAPRKTMQEEAEMDYEGEMARSELNAICDKSRKLADMMSDDMQLEAWLQSKITKAKYMIDSVYDYLMYSDKQSGMKSPMPSADASSYAQTPAMAANYSSFLNKMAEEKILSAKQKHKIDVNNNNKIDRNDFEILRSSEKGSDTKETTAHRKKIISKTVEEAVDDEEKADKQITKNNMVLTLLKAHSALSGTVGMTHPVKFDDGKHELDLKTIRRALDLHRDAKTAAEKERYQNAFKTHEGLLLSIDGKFAAPRSKVSLGGTERVGGIKPIKEYADPVTGEADPFTGKVERKMVLSKDKNGRPFWLMSSPGEIGIGKKTAAIKDTSVSEETMLNNLYHTLSEDNKATFMEKLRTEDGLTELLQFAQEQGL